MSFPNEQLKAIWAPWRVEYHRMERPLPDFLSRAATGGDRENLVVHRSGRCFLILNRYPYTCGHLMAVPNRKVGDIGELGAAERAEMWDLAVIAERILRKVLNANGFNIGFNIGKCAGAGVADHLHLHIVPRWEGDRNFMPVLAGESVIPDGLMSVYDKLVAARKEMHEQGTL